MKINAVYLTNRTESGAGSLDVAYNYGSVGDIAVAGRWYNPGSTCPSADGTGGGAAPCVQITPGPTPTLLSGPVELYVNDIPDTEAGVRCRQTPNSSSPVITLVPVCGVVQASGQTQEQVAGNRLRWYQVTCNGQLGWMAGAILPPPDTVLYLVSTRPASCPAPTVTPTPTITFTPTMTFTPSITPTGPTLTPSPTAITGNTAIIAELATYGITVFENGLPSTQVAAGYQWYLGSNQAWDSNSVELSQVLTGVRKTAAALQAVATNQTAGNGTTQAEKDRFRAVMVGISPLYILRVKNGFRYVPPPQNQGDPDDSCAGTIDQGCTNNDFAAIAFYGAVNVTEFTVVHELGHRFDNRSDQGGNFSLSERASVTGTTISDCTTTLDRVMGTALNDNNWRRGNRGWGSGPGFSSFQQNQTNDEGLTEREVREAMADMFLNWIYRRISDNNTSYFVLSTANDPNTNAPLHRTVACQQPQTETWEGFLNRSWISNEPCATSANGCADSTLPGNVRYAWMQAHISEIFLQQQW